MHIITFATIRVFCESYPNAKSGLESWYRLVKKLEFRNFVELRAVFPSADQVENLTVFNIGGNKYRLIALIDYECKKVFIRAVLTHAEYDEEKWKNDPWLN